MTIAIFSGCGSNETVDKISFPLVKDSKSDSIRLIKSRQFPLNPDYSHPVHSYLLFVGRKEYLLKFVESMGLFTISQKDSTSGVGNVYQNKKLWSTRGYHEVEKDKQILEEWEFNNIRTASFAAYFYSGHPNNIYISSENRWNGKITATIKGDTCLIFIEEIMAPEYNNPK